RFSLPKPSPMSPLAGRRNTGCSSPRQIPCTPCIPAPTAYPRRDMKALLIGRTGQLSLPRVLYALDRGPERRVCTRGNSAADLPPGVTSIVGDMSDRNTYAQLAARGFDTVCQFIAFTPDQVRQDIDTFSGETGQYVFISSASVYEKPAPHYVITEATPT